MRRYLAIPSSMSVPRWRAALWVAPAGLSIAVCVLGMIYAVVTAFVAAYPLLGRGDAPPGLVRGFGWAVGNWGVPIFLLLTAAVSVYLSARHPGNEPLGGGVPVGLAGALATALLVYTAFAGLLWWEGPVYLAVGLAGALSGAAFARRSRHHEAAFGYAGQLSAAAARPADLPPAIGIALAQLGAVCVTLRSFGAEPSGGGGTNRPASTEQFAYWDLPVPKGSRGEPRGHSPELVTSLPELPATRGRRGTPEIVRLTDLSEADRTVWSAHGVRAALILPLASATGEPVGQLAIFFRRRLFGGPLPRSVFSTGPRELAATASLALHNMSLVAAAAEASATKERKRYELDIHDTIVRDFATIVMRLQTVDPSSMPHWDRDALRTALRLARGGLQQARRLVSGTTELEAGTLGELVEKAARRCAEETGADVSVGVSGSPRRLDTDTEIVLLRVAQEALNNVTKHARAANVEVSLIYAADSAIVHVRDDGEGFDPSSNGRDAPSASSPRSPSRGLHGMSERLQYVGGALYVASVPGSGTRVFAEVPLAQPGIAQQRVRV